MVGVNHDVVPTNTNDEMDDLPQSPPPPRSFQRNHHPDDDYEYASEIHTSPSPGKRSHRSPLSAMDELDHRTHGADSSTAYDVATLSIDETNTSDDGTSHTSDDPPRSPNVATDTIHL